MLQYIIMHFEFNKALSGQVTLEQLQVARLTLAGIREVDPSKVEDGIVLAEALQGVSRAVSDIVLARGVVQKTDLGAVLPSDSKNISSIVTSSNILRRFNDPASRTGRMFIAQPDVGNGASMGVHKVTADEQRVTHDIQIPPDRLIDQLLMQEPCLWDEQGVYARDFRDSQPDIAYPFYNHLHTVSAVQRYFSILQELSADLLDA